MVEYNGESVGVPDGLWITPVGAWWVVPIRAVIGLVVVQGVGREERQQDTRDNEVGDDLHAAGQGEENEEQEKGDQYEHWLIAPSQKDDVGADRDDQADGEHNYYRKVAGVAAEFVCISHWLANCFTCDVPAFAVCPLCPIGCLIARYHLSPFGRQSPHPVQVCSVVKSVLSVFWVFPTGLAWRARVVVAGSASALRQMSVATSSLKAEVALTRCTCSMLFRIWPAENIVRPEIHAAIPAIMNLRQRGST
jgi:hypothetical protein